MKVSFIIYSKYNLSLDSNPSISNYKNPESIIFAFLSSPFVLKWKQDQQAMKGGLHAKKLENE